MNTNEWFRKCKCKIFVALFISVLLMVSCSYSEEKAAKQSAVSFAQDYFNLRYKQALSVCTPESGKWIRFKATNTTQEDVDVYNAQQDTAECDVESIELNDDKAIVIVEVRKFLKNDSIGKPSFICPKAKVEIMLKKVSQKWLVDIQTPLIPYI